MTDTDLISSNGAYTYEFSWADTEIAVEVERSPESQKEQQKLYFEASSPLDSRDNYFEVYNQVLCAHIAQDLSGLTEMCGDNPTEIPKDVTAPEIERLSGEEGWLRWALEVPQVPAQLHEMVDDYLEGIEMKERVFYSGSG